MLTMYAKLFSRITESSLMEEPVPTRYVFMMMLAIADPKGYVIGTDIAISRRMNLKLDEFLGALKPLMEPDPHSNSMKHDGRRVIQSDGERGYYLVNYTTYRDLVDEDNRRAYMREYMRERRAKEKGEDSVNLPLTVSTQAEEEEEAKEEQTYGSGWVPNDLQKTINRWFHRRDSTPWQENEIRSLKKLPKTTDEDFVLLEKRYTSKTLNYRRKEIVTLLNNWQSEIDKANEEFSGSSQPKKKSEFGMLR